MSTYLLTIGLTISLIMVIGLIGIAVDRWYRAFARRNPQLGPFRDSNGCCGCCSSKGSCSRGSCTTPR